MRTGRDPLVVDAGGLMKRPADIGEAYYVHVGIVSAARDVVAAI